jgi:hypothetical protein
MQPPWPPHKKRPPDEWWTIGDDEDKRMIGENDVLIS